VDPVIGFMLWQAEDLALHDLQHIRFYREPNEEQTILGGGQRTIGRGSLPAPSSWLAVQTARFHALLKRFLKGWYQLVKLFHDQTGHLQNLLLFLTHLGVSPSTH
jgi:hypothetical protein